MDRALFIAMTGAKNNMFSQTAHANNLANARTTGFKADFAQARAMPVFGEHHPSRAYSMSERPASDFNDGSLIATGNALDISIMGDGFFEVTGEDGAVGYTRRGDLSVAPDGSLINGVGQPINGGGGAITLPAYENVHIGEDGTITIRPAGAGPDALVVVDQIKIVNPDFQNFEKGTDGLFRPLDGGVLEQDPLLRVASGFVENSNVNAVNELVNILSISRQYETQVKMMRSADEMTQKSAELLRFA